MPTNEEPSKLTGSYDSPAGDLGTYPNPGVESAALGYETTDVNVRGVVVFVGGLSGFVLIFFVFCFLLGRVINAGIEKNDGPADKWHQGPTQELKGTEANNLKTPNNVGVKKLENLKSASAMEQQQLAIMTASFPGPQLQTDDGNQATADLHAKEDLLLNYYSKTPNSPSLRIPIDQAMKAIVQKGLPVEAAAQQGPLLAHDETPKVTAPLTSGFARTGYELEEIEAREQKLEFSKANANAQATADVKPIR